MQRQEEVELEVFREFVLYARTKGSNSSSQPTAFGGG
jgi:hypothetical protein